MGAYITAHAVRAPIPHLERKSVPFSEPREPTKEGFFAVSLPVGVA